jgi:NDP-hexose-3-ketoreductase
MTDTTAPSTTLGLGVLGCADVAWRRTLPSVQQVPGLRLVAVASRDRRKAAGFTERFGGEPVEGFAGVLERDDVDAVYVPLPTALHAEWAGRALRAGKHVLVEKPLAATAAEAVDLVRAARERGLVLMENFAFLHHSMYTTVRGLLDAGTIGELRTVVSEFAFPPLPDGDIRYRPELGGGALLDAGVYSVRAALAFLGSGLDVCGACLRIDGGSGVDVAGTALLSAPSGATAQLSFGFIHSYRCSYVLWGSTGRIAVDRAYTAPDTFAPTVRVETAQGTEQLVLPPDAQFANLLAGFVTAVHGESDTDRQRREAAIVEQAELVEHIAGQARRMRA